MIDIQASPELMYALWVLWLLFLFLSFAVYTISARAMWRDKRWGWFVFFLFTYLVGMYNTVAAVHRLSLWYDVLARLKGW